MRPPVHHICELLLHLYCAAQRAPGTPVIGEQVPLTCPLKLDISCDQHNKGNSEQDFCAIMTQR